MEAKAGPKPGWQMLLGKDNKSGMVRFSLGERELFKIELTPEALLQLASNLTELVCHLQPPRGTETAPRSHGPLCTFPTTSIGVAPSSDPETVRIVLLDGHYGYEAPVDSATAAKFGRALVAASAEIEGMKKH